MPHIADTAAANGVEFEFNPTGVVVEQRVEDLDSSAERMEEETMCQQYDDHRQVRENKNAKAIAETISDIKKFTNFSDVQCGIMLKAMSGRISTLETAISRREEDALQANAKNAQLHKVIEKFQTSQHHKDDEEEASSQCFDQDHTAIMDCLKRQNIQTVSDFEEFLRERYNDLFLLREEQETVERLRKDARKLESAQNALQTMQNALRTIQSSQKDLRLEFKAKVEECHNLEFVFQEKHNELVEVRQQLNAEKEKSRLLKLKLEMVQEEKGKLVKDSEWMEANLKANSYTRIGEKEHLRNYKNESVQIMAPTLTSSGSTETQRVRVLPGEPNKKWDEGIERPRFSERAEETLEAAEIEDESFLENARRSPEYMRSRKVTVPKPQSRESLVEVFGQWMMNQHLPEPPKFSAQESTVSLQSFKKSFLMKYGQLDDEDQRNLLETKFLTGKARQVFRGLPDSEKRSVDIILNALANRLRISPEDESRRAKKAFEDIRYYEGQSIEDFCLQIDEIAVTAYRRCSAEEFSSLKMTKLQSALLHNPSLACMIDNKLGEIPERDHYDTARRMVVRWEMGFQQYRGSSSENTKSKLRTTRVPPALPPLNTWNPGALPPVPKVRSNAPEQKWRTGNLIQSDSLKTCDVRQCAECHSVGFHHPHCPKAPGAQKVLKEVTCFRCNEKGHIAPNCPNQPNSSFQASELLNEPKIDSIEKEKCLVVTAEADKPLAKIEHGRIGSADVNILWDSGASISLMARKTWERIAATNGSEWERTVKLEQPIQETVYAVNNQPIDLFFQVTLKTAMQAR
uniref:CCHC-type domain-containing protein n=1 Tax=Caenorhabditis japonica TaxID=281687 RepID=A0A8R1DKT2_CAEJA